MNERTKLHTSHSAKHPSTEYVHWLPTQTQLSTHQDQTALGCTRMEDYVPFDGLVHATHVQAARSILQDGAIRGHPVLDNSVANVKDGKDPFRRVLATAHCVWLAPNCSAGDFFVFHLGL